MNSEKSYIEGDELETLFFDSYAFFEILKGSQNYVKYQNNYRIVTSKLNLFELYFGVLQNNNESNAQRILEIYSPFVVDFNEEVIINAAKLKLLLNKREVSMADCIGYALAKQLGIKFLTGDSVFQGMENVEFVK